MTWICFYQGGKIAYIATGATAEEAEARMEQTLGMLPTERRTYEEQTPAREMLLLPWEKPEEPAE